MLASGDKKKSVYNFNHLIRTAVVVSQLQHNCQSLTSIKNVPKGLSSTAFKDSHESPQKSSHLKKMQFLKVTTVRTREVE